MLATPAPPGTARLGERQGNLVVRHQPRPVRIQRQLLQPSSQLSRHGGRLGFGDNSRFRRQQAARACALQVVVSEQPLLAARPFSTSDATSPSIKSTSTPGRPRCRSSLSVKTPFRPRPSAAVSPASQAKARTEPARASILARPRPISREPRRMVLGLLRQASRSMRLRWHPRLSTRCSTCCTRSAL